MLPLLIGAAGLQTAATGLQIYGQIRRAHVEAQVAENNARLARAHAADSQRRGALVAGETLAEGRRVAAEATLAAGSGGIDPNSGSMANLTAQSAANAAIDAARIRSNAAREAWGLRAQEADYRRQAKEARKAGLLGAVGTGLSGASSAAFMVGSGAGGAPAGGAQ